MREVSWSRAVTHTGATWALEASAPQRFHPMRSFASGAHLPRRAVPRLVDLFRRGRHERASPDPLRAARGARAATAVTGAHYSERRPPSAARGACSSHRPQHPRSVPSRWMGGAKTETTADVPTYLTRCSACGGWQNKTRGILCLCDGLVCSACGKARRHRPISNYYDDAAGVVVHVPWFGYMLPCPRCGKRDWRATT